jgi:tetratricopeptide (TPR) repeat protein
MRSIPLAALMLLLIPGDDADRAFRAGDHDAAAGLYARALEQEPGSARLAYNRGTALLRAGRYDEAREALAAVADTAGGVLQRARYNAGNTDLEPAMQRGAAPSRPALERAVSAYRAALRLDPADADAKWNLELAQRLLDRLPDAPQGGGGGGGEGGGEGSPADAPPRPGGTAGTAPDLSPAQAAELLQGAADREQAVQQQRLRRREAPPPRVRDW